MPIRTDALKEGDSFKVHCFKNDRGYVDETGRVISSVINPCGEYYIVLLNRLAILLAHGLGLIDNPDSLEDIRKLPTVTTLNVAQPKGRGVDVTVSIPLQDLLVMDVDMYELEDDLNALLYPKYGKWVETVTGAGERHIIFEAKPQHTQVVIDKIDGKLKILGFSRYNIAQAEPD